MVSVSLSCKRLPNPKQHAPIRTGPRNLTPGLSEELTALAERHGSLWLLIAVPSENDEEAGNLAGLIEKAVETGGWKVVAREVSPRPIQGLYCTYNPQQQKIADDLISVFESKGLTIKCSKRDDPVALPLMSLEVGSHPKP